MGSGADGGRSLNVDWSPERIARIRRMAAAARGGIWTAFREREAFRRKWRLPAVLIVGHGRAGKDETARLLVERTPLRYAASSSKAGLSYAAEELEVGLSWLWQNRHSHREVLRQWWDHFRADYPEMLSMISLGLGDIVVGTRALPEFQATARLADMIIWVDRPDIPPDPTLEYRWEDVKATGKGQWLFNDAGLAELAERVEIVATKLGLGDV